MGNSNKKIILDNNLKLLKDRKDIKSVSKIDDSGQKFVKAKIKMKQIYKKYGSDLDQEIVRKESITLSNDNISLNS